MIEYRKCCAHIGNYTLNIVQNVRIKSEMQNAMQDVENDYICTYCTWLCTTIDYMYTWTV